MLQDSFQEWIMWHKDQISSYHTKDLAAYLGVSPRTIQRWMKNKGKPGEIQLQRITQYNKENS
jgi:uncharacterized protein YjcR